MDPLRGALAGFRPVTSLSLADMAGEGDKAGRVSPYARAIARHADKSGRPVCVAGWSTGAVAAIEAAVNFPGKIAGLALLSATARFCSGEEYSAGVSPALLRAMIRRLRRDPEATVADFISEALHPLTVSADDLAERTRKGLRQGTDCLAGGLEYLARVDLRSALPQIAAPCLVIHGMLDRIVPWQAARLLTARLSSSEAEFLPSAGHCLIEQGGKEIVHRIGRFVESLD